MPGTRTRDPGRRDRIAAAATVVVAEYGVEGLTHRRVAQAAGVPLGSTTYYFAGLDDLLAAALQHATDRWALEVGDRTGQLAGTSRRALAEGIVDWVLDYCFGDSRERAVVEYEVYVAALRRPSLHAIAMRYTEITVAALTELTDARTADALAALIDGICLRLLLSHSPPEREHLVTIVATVAGG